MMEKRKNRCHIIEHEVCNTMGSKGLCACPDAHLSFRRLAPRAFHMVQPTSAVSVQSVHVVVAQRLQNFVVTYAGVLVGLWGLPKMPVSVPRKNQQADKVAKRRSQSKPDRPTAADAGPDELDAIEKKHPEDRTDFELLKLYVQRASTDAFETLVQRHRRQVYNFIFKMVRKAEAAEDIFQDTFVRVIKNAHKYTPRAKFTTWTLQIARNLTLDYFKRENLRQHVSIDAGRTDDDKGIAGLLKGLGPESSEVLLSRELVDEVREAVTRLPENQREALVLRMYEDLPYAEISEVLGSPEGTVKYWVHEAVNTLARYLERRGLK